MNSRQEALHENVFWVRRVPLNISDELTVKIVESDEYDPFKVLHTFGTRAQDGDIPEFFCSFCGTSAKDVGDMHI
jgi:hypothetical protein